VSESNQSDRYLVMGNPIAHSKSPQIHRLFAQQTRQNLSYTTLLVELDRFDEAFNKFQQQGGKGANVTVPFKQDAYRAAHELSPRAQRAGAVNTLMFKENGECFGDNTDGIGLLRDVTQNYDVTLSGARVLLLGAGGAVRGVLGPLLEAQPKGLVIANRTVEKAVSLAEEFSELGRVTGCGFADLKAWEFDLIINGTAASLQGEMPPLPGSIIATNGTCYDMMYAREPTVFMRWSSKHGATLIVDGLGMLVEQAAEAFFIWRGVRPDTRSVINALR